MSEKPSVTLDEAIDWAIAVASGHEPNLLKIHTQAIARHLTALKRIEEAVPEEVEGWAQVLEKPKDPGHADRDRAAALLRYQAAEIAGCERECAILRKNEDELQTEVEELKARRTLECGCSNSPSAASNSTNGAQVASKDEA